MKALLGTTVLGIEITADKKAIRFSTDNGPRVWYTDGDCCSESWIEHLSGVDALLGQKVLEVDDIDMPEATGELGDDVLRFYGVSLHTEKGIAKLEYRNASNGYYGGSIVEIEPEPQDASLFLRSLRTDLETWAQVKEDF